MNEMQKMIQKLTETQEVHPFFLGLNRYTWSNDTVLHTQQSTRKNSTRPDLGAQYIANHLLGRHSLDTADWHYSFIRLELPNGFVHWFSHSKVASTVGHRERVQAYRLISYLILKAGYQPQDFSEVTTRENKKGELTIVSVRHSS